MTSGLCFVSSETNTVLKQYLYAKGKALYFYFLFVHNNILGYGASEAHALDVLLILLKSLQKGMVHHFVRILEQPYNEVYVEFPSILTYLEKQNCTKSLLMI